MRTLRTLIADAELALAAGPHPGRAARDAETLLLHLTGQNRAWLFTHEDDASSLETEAAYTSLVTRRAAGEPIQYITGSAEFFGLPFSVGPGVLIPRPETEHLVEEVIRLAETVQANPIRIADIGTGSGIIAVALAHALPRAQIDAVDLSPQALHIARENAERNHASRRIHFHEGDLLAPLADERFHIIASNPPYIPSTDHDSLAIEVRQHEPHTALFAGEDGLALYRRLIPAAHEHLHRGGWLVMEIGHSQHDAIHLLLEDSSFDSIRFISDYQQIPRVAIAQKQKG
jgi:release factor glutamine methyltransferase